MNWFRYGKGEQRKRVLDLAATGLARKRFEDREVRLLRVKQERAEKMVRRKQLLKDKMAQQDRIQASIDRARKKGETKQGIEMADRTRGKPDDT